MRQLLPVLAAALAVAAAGPAAAQSIMVPIDQSTRLPLPVGVTDVMIGNPAVADVNVADGRSLVVLGKSAGVTNLLVVDALGRTLINRQVVVSAPATGQVSLFRGVEQETYACADRCSRMAGAASSEPLKVN